MLSPNQSTKYYGSGKISGYRYKDAVYIDKNQTYGGVDMEYFLITQQ